MSESRAELIASLPAPQRQAILSALTEDDFAELERDWRFWARPEQIAPEGEWSTWLALAGRGWGKTEAGANWIKEREEDGARQIALIAETQKDLEEVMVPRILSLYPDSSRPVATFRPVRLRWPSGAFAFGYVGNEPEQLRGPEFDTAWIDELAKYKRTDKRDYAQETWDMLQFTMRRPDPRVLVTTTPRPIPIIKALAQDPTTRISTGSTYDNARNLAPQFLEQIKKRYEGTRLGRQELRAEILNDVPGALWKREWIVNGEIPIDLRRVIVAVDPSGTGGPDADEVEGDDIGIVVAAEGIDGKYYVLEDATCQLSPAAWGRRVVQMYGAHSADRIVAERNFGGAMVEMVIRSADRNARVKMVTASRGKAIRAEPIAALYEQGRVVHAHGMEELEDEMLQMTAHGFVGRGSPNRTDALVWALTELALEQTSTIRVSAA